MDREEFRRDFTSQYCWLMKNNKNLLDQIFPYRFRWTKELCVKSAKPFRTVVEWRKYASGAVDKAYAKGWINECCTHMLEKSKRAKQKTKKVRNVNTSEVFESVTKAANKYKTSRGTLINQIKGLFKTAGGHQWSYCDENGNPL